MAEPSKEENGLGDRISKFLSTRIGISNPASSNSKAVSFVELSNSKPAKPKKLSSYRSRVIRSPNAIVHLEYPPDSPPTKPSDGQWTRFVCISDTHTREIDVPDGDVLLHSGDLTNTGTVKDFKKTMSWLCWLPHKVKIIIAGNHDLTLHTEWYKTNGQDYHGRVGMQDINQILPLLKGKMAQTANLVYLQDELYKFRLEEGRREWSIYGSPWSPEFCNWAFGYEPEDAEDLISKFPKADILLTHGPPRNLLDRTNTGELAGCRALRKRLPYLKPMLHVFGHIHEAHGAYLHNWEDKLPKVQNNQERGVEDSSSLEKHLEGEDPLQGLEESFEDQQISDNEFDESDEDSEDISSPKDKTVSTDRPSIFVNAAAWPMGALSKRDGSKMSMFGGPGFQAVIVDLKD